MIYFASTETLLEPHHHGETTFTQLLELIFYWVQNEKYSPHVFIAEKFSAIKCVVKVFHFGPRKKLVQEVA